MDAPRKTEFEQQHFFRQCLSGYTRAAEQGGEHRLYYELAGTVVCIAFAGEAMVPLLSPALAHLQIEGDGHYDALFCVWDSESTGVEMPPPPCAWSAFTDRGDIWGFNSPRIRTAWHWGEFSVNVMDLEQNTAVFWVDTARALPYWSVASPFRTLFHWWMEKNGGQLLHAAAVGTPEGAVLITGKGGVGKSTTALSCLDAGMLYLSDDYLLVTELPEPRVHSLYSTAKLNWDDLDRFPRLAPWISEPLKAEQEKANLFLHPGLKDSIVKNLPLKAILTPSFGDGPETSLKSVPFWTIRGNMAFTTMSQLPYAGKQTNDYIVRLCSKLPIYELRLGKEISRIPGILRELISTPAHSTENQSDIRDTGIRRPLISVIVPVYNGEAFIREAIDNILGQDYPALEIIMVNDGSTDRSEELIQALECDIRYFRQENAGPAAARNRGIRDASGEFIAFLDVDDLWPDDNLHYLVNEIQKNPGALVVHGYAQLLQQDPETGTYRYEGNPGESFPGYIGAGLYRREVFQRVGLFDTMMRFGEDADWFKRATELDIPLRKLEEVTLFVRRHGGNMTQGKDLVELNALKVFKKSLDRKRGKLTIPGLENKEVLPVSVIIPCYNAERYLGEAIESILSREAIPREIIVVDDGSIDDSLIIAESYPSPVKVVRQANRGAAAARNHGVLLASQDYLCFLDADDQWVGDMPKVLFEALNASDRPDIAFGMVEQFISPELAEEQHSRLREELKTMPGLLMGAMMIRREAFDRVGSLDETLDLAEFIDWMSRATQLGLKHKVLPSQVMRRRIHTSNQGILKKDKMQDYTAVARAALRRSRNREGL
jgi:glycosyltransferase involved in cell wall biosynthesis